MRFLLAAAGLVLATFAYVPGADAQSAGSRAFSEAFGPCRGDTCVVRQSPGGNVAKFMAAAAAVNAGAKRLVVIDGLCASACVIFADRARDRVCITERASFGFHKATVYQALRGSAERKWRQVAQRDPSHSRDIAHWVARNGGFPAQGLNVMRNREAQKFWRRCELARR